MSVVNQVYNLVYNNGVTGTKYVDRMVIRPYMLC